MKFYQLHTLKMQAKRVRQISVSEVLLKTFLLQGYCGGEMSILEALWKVSVRVVVEKVNNE